MLKFHFECSPFVRAKDKRLMLETSASSSFHRVNSTLINLFDTKILRFTSSPTWHHSFFRHWTFQTVFFRYKYPSSTTNVNQMQSYKQKILKQCLQLRAIFTNPHLCHCKEKPWWQFLPTMKKEDTLQINV